MTKHPFTNPESLAQKQLDAYNAHDIDVFLSVYSPDVQIFTHPSELAMSGLERMREHYGKLFEDQPQLQAELVNRMKLGNYVIDHERITGRTDREPFEAIAMYEIKDGFIQKVWFLTP